MTADAQTVVALLAVPAAAVELCVAPRTLQRWLAAGAPAVRPGRRGRGGRALVDPAAIRAWRARGEAVDHAHIVLLAAEVPHLVAAAVFEAFKEAEISNKPALAGVLAASWVYITVALLDRLREDVPTLSGPAEWPAQIGHLRAINAHSGKTDGTGNTR